MAEFFMFHKKQKQLYNLPKSVLNNDSVLYKCFWLQNLPAERQLFAVLFKTDCKYCQAGYKAWLKKTDFGNVVLVIILIFNRIQAKVISLIKLEDCSGTGKLQKNLMRFVRKGHTLNH